MTITDVAPSAAPTADCAPCSRRTDQHMYPLESGATVHCIDCHREWTSGRECHCVGCHRHFVSERAFTAHQFTDGCHDPAEVVRRDGTPRFVAHSSRWGLVWKLAFYGTLPDFGRFDATSQS